VASRGAGRRARRPPLRRTPRARRRATPVWPARARRARRPRRAASRGGGAAHATQCARPPARRRPRGVAAARTRIRAPRHSTRPAGGAAAAAAALAQPQPQPQPGLAGGCFSILDAVAAYDQSCAVAGGGGAGGDGGGAPGAASPPAPAGARTPGLRTIGRPAARGGGSGGKRSRLQRLRREDSGGSDKSEETHAQACASSSGVSLQRGGGDDDSAPGLRRGGGAAAAAAGGAEELDDEEEVDEPEQRQHQVQAAQAAQPAQAPAAPGPAPAPAPAPLLALQPADLQRKLALIQQLQQQQALLEQFHSVRRAKPRQRRPSPSPGPADAGAAAPTPADGRGGQPLLWPTSAPAPDVCSLLGGRRRPLIDAHLRANGLGPAAPMGRAERRLLGVDAPASPGAAGSGGWSPGGGSSPEKDVRGSPRAEDAAADQWAELDEWAAVEGALATSPREQKRIARLVRERQRLAMEAPGPAFAGGAGRVVRRLGAGSDSSGDEGGGGGGATGAARARSGSAPRGPGGGGGAPAGDASAPRAQRPPRAPRPARPWQPKLEKDEANWRGAEAFRSFVSGAEESLVRGAGPKTWPRAAPAHATARLAVLLLLHSPGWPNWRIWEEWARTHPEGEVVLFIHMKAGVALSPGMPGLEAIQRCRLRTSVSSEWGNVNLVQVRATLRGPESGFDAVQHGAAMFPAGGAAEGGARPLLRAPPDCRPRAPRRSSSPPLLSSRPLGPDRLHGGDPPALPQRPPHRPRERPRHPRAHRRRGAAAARRHALRRLPVRHARAAHAQGRDRGGAARDGRHGRARGGRVGRGADVPPPVDDCLAGARGGAHRAAQGRACGELAGRHSGVAWWLSRASPRRQRGCSCRALLALLAPAAAARAGHHPRLAHAPSPSAAPPPPPQYGRAIHRATASVHAGMAPDEFIVVTALKAHGLVKSVQVGAAGRATRLGG
jgi:hypothetical protein